jgi:hypothetical protein
MKQHNPCVSNRRGGNFHAETHSQNSKRKSGQRRFYWSTRFGIEDSFVEYVSEQEGNTGLKISLNVITDGVSDSAARRSCVHMLKLLRFHSSTVVEDSWLTLISSSFLFCQLLLFLRHSFMWRFKTRNVLWDGIVSTMPNQHPGGPVD